MNFCSMEFWVRAGLLPAYKALYYISLSTSTQCHDAVFILKGFASLSLFFSSLFLFLKTATVYTSAVWLYFSTALTTTSKYKKGEL